jgi:hypothetical protein
MQNRVPLSFEHWANERCFRDKANEGGYYVQWSCVGGYFSAGTPAATAYCPAGTGAGRRTSDWGPPWGLAGVDLCSVLMLISGR